MFLLMRISSSQLNNLASIGNQSECLYRILTRSFDFVACLSSVRITDQTVLENNALAVPIRKHTGYLFSLKEVDIALSMYI